MRETSIDKYLNQILFLSESLNIFTVVICMPVRWKVSNNPVLMSPFSDDENIYKYSDVQQILRFALLIQFLSDQNTIIVMPISLTHLILE